MTALALREVVAYLDGYLRVRDIPDYDGALNGLQVENGGQVARVVAAVDASLESILGAANGQGPALLLVHHGLFWDGNQALVGRRYRRMRGLVDHDTALYAAHIPLDLHPDVGNNAVLARQLGVRVEGTFGKSRGVDIGVHGALETTRDALVARLDHLLRTDSHLIPGGPDDVQRVGIITGAASSAIAEAVALGLDTFVTGEGPHHTHFDAMEWGINVIYAGHYATEQVGVQALAEHLGATFGLPWEFHWHPTGL